MGKALKTVGMVIGAAALIASGVGALAMPGLAGTTTLFGVSTGTLNMVSAGLTAVGGLLDKPQSAGSGSPEDWTSSPDQPTPFAFGRIGVAGKRVHRDEFGSDNFRQGVVSIYSGAGPIKSFVSYKADDLYVSFGVGGAAIGKYAGQMWRDTRLGAQPDTALSLSLPGGQNMPAWDSRYKLSGKACDLLVVQQDSKFSVYPSGVPTPTVVLEGIYGYDPRYDDTYPGGAGTCRLGVRSTYRWIDNPIIAALNWALGLIENGQVVGGVGASIDGIDVPAFVEAANIADANNWKVAAWPDTSEDVSQVLKQFLQAGGASYARHAGKISCVSRGAARPSIVTITARDTCGPMELDTGSSSFNRLNTITPEFMSEAHGWKKVPADPVTFASLRVEDGGKKSDSIGYRFVPAVKQAGQLAAYDILDAREPFSGTVPLKPHLRRLKRGDCFVIDEPGFLLDGVKCLVLSRTYQAQTGEVRIAFRSETDGKHDLALGKTTTMPEYPELTPADPTLVTPPQADDFTVTFPGPAPDGSQLPNIDLTGVVSNATADALLISWRAVAGGEDPNIPPAYQDPDGNVLPGWVDAGTYAPTIRSLSIQGPQPGAVIWLALRYRRGSNFSAAELKGPITVQGMIAGDVSTTAPTIVDLQGQITTAFGDIFDVSGLLADARAEIDAQGVEIAAARNGEANLAARIATVNQARIDGDGANALAITNLTARTANTEADIIDIENAAAAETAARVQAITRLQASANGGLNQNPSFAAWSGALPDTYGGVSTGNGSISKVAGINGQPNAMRVTSTSTADIAVNQFTQGAKPGGEWMVVEAEWTLVAGNMKGSGISFLPRNAAGGFVLERNIDFFTEFGAGAVGQTYRVSKLLDGRNASTAQYAFNLWTRRAAFSPVGAATIDWRRISIRPATESEIATGTVLPGLQASVTEHTLAIIDLENQQALAAYELLANATGGDPAYLRLVSSTAGGYAALAAPVVALQTTSGGQVKTALRAVNGEIHIADKLYLGDDGLWVFDPVTKTESIRGAGFAKVRGRGFGLNGDLTEWSGPNIAIGLMSKANGVRWEDINGNAYYGGSLSAGVLTSKAATSSLSFGATTETAKFGSNGGSIKVTLSLSGSWAKQYWSATNLAAASENGNVVVTLYRSVNGGAFSAVATLPMTYGWNRANLGNEPGLGWSIAENGSYGASLTYTDPQTIVQDRQYRATITTFSPNTLPGALTNQTLSIICVE